MWLLEITKNIKSDVLKQEVVGSYTFSELNNLVDYIETELEGKCYDAYPLYWTVKYKGRYRAASAKLIQ